VSLQRRLGGLQRHLTGAEGARAAVTALRRGRPPDPALRADLSEAERREYARLLHIVRRIGLEGGTLALVYDERARGIAAAAGWLTLCRRIWPLIEPARAYFELSGAEAPAWRSLRGEAAASLEALFGIVRPDPRWFPDWAADGSVPAEPSWVTGLTDGLRTLAQGLWQELDAVEYVIEEFADEFGADPAMPEVRTGLAAARTRLEAVAADPWLGELLGLAGIGTSERGTPDAELVEVAREVLGLPRGDR
jgi:hypothetical protein